ncbi:FecCD family ABC transporter permease [Glutamicibacter sp. NPDC087344]|uniref:FecCD family ABC transporter permease n=1 Tax=Glutamicibacter sp. NPDC087344 TaxID=3363994 RepID=UPI0037F4DE8C
MDQLPAPATLPAAATTRRVLWCVLAAALLLVAFALSLMTGAKPIPPGLVFSALGGNGEQNEVYLVLQSRLPRAVLGVVVGMALGVAGALIQAFTRNPLADPGILGVNAGAAFAVTLGVAFLGVSSIHGYLWFAFAGAGAVTVVVYLLGTAGRGGISPLQLTLVGVAVAALLGGITSGIMISFPAAFDQMRDWGAGTISGRDWPILLAVLPFIVIALVLALIAAPTLNAVALGDELAQSLGARVVRTRALVIIAVTLLAGAATAAAGPIGFVGLMVPHVCRWLLGPDQRWILALTLVAAPLLVTVSDVLGRVIIAPQELQVGIVTALFGAPVLVILARRAKISGL